MTQGEGNIFKTEAQELIVRLKTESGWSYAQIGEALGRDRSLISQAARGAKPIVNALPALRALTSQSASSAGTTPPQSTGRSSSQGEGRISESPRGTRQTPSSIPTVPRRTGRSGVANVRGGLVFPKDGGAHVQTKKEDFLVQQIQQAADKKQWVQIGVKVDKVAWNDGSKERHRNINLYRKGYSAEAIMRRVAEYIQEAAAQGQTVTPGQALGVILRGDVASATSPKGGRSAGMGEMGKVEQYEAELSDAAPW